MYCFWHVITELIVLRPNSSSPLRAARCHQGVQTVSQSPGTALTAGIRLPSGLCKGTVSGLWQPVEIPTSHVSPQSIATRGNPNLYLDQPITKGWCQPIRGHVPYLTDSPNVTRLGLCSSHQGVLQGAILNQAFIAQVPSPLDGHDQISASSSLGNIYDCCGRNKLWKCGKLFILCDNGRRFPILLIPNQHLCHLPLVYS